MTGGALLLSADHADPTVAARAARRRLSDGEPAAVDAMRLVAAVIEDGFSEDEARAAVDELVSADADTASTTDDHTSIDAAPTRSCTGGVERLVSDD